MTNPVVVGLPGWGRGQLTVCGSAGQTLWEGKEFGKGSMVTCRKSRIFRDQLKPISSFINIGGFSSNIIKMQECYPPTPANWLLNATAFHPWWFNWIFLYLHLSLLHIHVLIPLFGIFSSLIARVLRFFCSEFIFCIWYEGVFYFDWFMWGCPAFQAQFAEENVFFHGIFLPL